MIVRRALLSVFDKTGIVTFARAMAQNGIELIASGGTARALRAAGIPLRLVSDVTGCPEILGGRIKTLHPAVHAGLLSRRTLKDRAELEGQGWSEIDLVAVNLYDFEGASGNSEADLDSIIEQIDIGGVALLRAAAKNCAHVVSVCDPTDYAEVLREIEREGSVLLQTRRRLAVKAFARTAAYDTAIRWWAEARWSPPLPGGGDGRALPQRLVLDLDKWADLRYGENPHQRAALYAPPGAAGPLGGELLQGKPLSYNNLLDLDAAWRAVGAFEEPGVAIVKHLSPCGIACGEALSRAFLRAHACDPVSAFGSVIAVNRPFDGAVAQAMGDLFVEAIAAPAFSQAARDVLRTRQGCRLLRIDESGEDESSDNGFEIRGIRGGLVAQERDQGDQAEWQVVTRRAPTQGEMAALRFAWRAVTHVKSNAILLARGQAAVGIGGGLPSRVDAVRLAVAKAGEQASGAVMASDAFFPFPDGVELAAEAGVIAVVQPGGAARDEQVIDAADRHGMAMCFTGVRHFRH